MKVLRHRGLGCLLGLAVGDAVGTTLEFKTPGSFQPIQDMMGGGPFRLEKGQWTDDTAMTLCLGQSLAECRGFDANDQMQRYSRWQSDGYMSCTGHCFDIGITVSRALIKYSKTGDPFAGSSDPLSSGNGALMRLAPIPLFYAFSHELAVQMAAESTRTTHGSLMCTDSSRLFCDLVLRAMNAKHKEQVFFTQYHGITDEISELLTWNFLNQPMGDMTGSGFVIDSLKSALWCFWHGNSFRESVLMAANLGNDADTTAAICGQIAGAYYGAECIPSDWLESLWWREKITAMGDRLLDAAVSRAA